LLVIDMQRDFVEPGGFGEMLGTTAGRLWEDFAAHPVR
jgi:nicotinamidase-related amidase